MTFIGPKYERGLRSIQAKLGLTWLSTVVVDECWNGLLGIWHFRKYIIVKIFKASANLFNCVLSTFYQIEYRLYNYSTNIHSITVCFFIKFANMKYLVENVTTHYRSVKYLLVCCIRTSCCCLNVYTICRMVRYNWSTATDDIFMFEGCSFCW